MGSSSEEVISAVGRLRFQMPCRFRREAFDREPARLRAGAVGVHDVEEKLLAGAAGDDVEFGRGRR